jgi:hypothetical protein
MLLFWGEGRRTIWVLDCRVLAFCILHFGVLDFRLDCGLKHTRIPFTIVLMSHFAYKMGLMCLVVMLDDTRRVSP